MLDRIEMYLRAFIQCGRLEVFEDGISSCDFGGKSIVSQ